MVVRGAAALWPGLGVGGTRRAEAVREHLGSAPCGITVPNELTKENSWGGSAPPNGSRLSCGRPTHRRNDRWTTGEARKGHTTPVPLRRSPPGSFKRLLGACSV